MSRRYTHALVVDTSVAQAAGSKGSVAPRSVSCRTALDQMLASVIGVVMSRALWKEWSDVDPATGRKHMSPYSSRWLTQMKGRKLYWYVCPPPTSSTLIQAIDQHLPTDGARAAVRKDLLLVDAALDSDRRVLSLDDTVQGHLRSLSAYEADIADIHWTNPQDARCVTWMSTGASDEQRLTLGRRP